MSPFELDRHVHRDLRRLPPPTAPADFTARVLAARRAFDARPWYRKAWWAWPRHWQAVSAIGLAAWLVLVTMAAPVALQWAAEAMAAAFAQHAPQATRVAAVVEAMWEALVRPLTTLLLPLVLLMWAACAAGGLMLARLVSGETSR